MGILLAFIPEIVLGLLALAATFTALAILIGAALIRFIITTPERIREARADRERERKWRAESARQDLIRKAFKMQRYALETCDHELFKKWDPRQFE